MKKVLIIMLWFSLVLAPTGATNSHTQETSTQIQEESKLTQERRKQVQDTTNIAQERVMTIDINGTALVCDLVDNSATRALISLLQQGDISYVAHDYGNFEKVGYIGHTLPTNDEYISTQAGDVILYQGDNICIFYNNNAWDYTRLGKIRGLTQQGLIAVLGSGDVNVRLSLGEPTSIETNTANATHTQQAYTIDGRRTSPMASSIVIVDGKKKLRIR